MCAFDKWKGMSYFKLKEENKKRIKLRKEKHGPQKHIICIEGRFNKVCTMQMP
jgi:hypothetical protein